jgi:hypothetical protein
MGNTHGHNGLDWFRPEPYVQYGDGRPKCVFLVTLRKKMMGGNAYRITLVL